MKDYIKNFRTNDKLLLVKQTISSLEEVQSANLLLHIYRSYIVALEKIAALSITMQKIAGKEILIGGLYVNQVSKIVKRQPPFFALYSSALLWLT